MKLVVQTLTLLLVVSAGFAQDTPKQPVDKPAEEKKLAGFEWLRQFEGSWKTESKQPGQEAPASNATFKARAVGNQWMVCEHSGLVGGMQFDAVQTLGYNSETKKFDGSWIDSTSRYKWKYDGKLSGDGKTLLLEAEGPDWTDATKMRMYRDTYEFKSKKEIAFQSQIKNEKGEWETFMSGKITRDETEKAATAAPAKTPAVTPFLMFIGEAEDAINLYKSVFPNTQVESMVKYKAGESGKEGTVQLATIIIEGQRVKCIDSPAVHDFDFTPSFSFFVECESEEQLKERFAKLSDGGKVMMPVNNYGFSKQFGWVSDKFGVSWQLNLK